MKLKKKTGIFVHKVERLILEVWNRLIPSSARRILKKVWFFGLNHYCPVCNSHVRKFYTFGLLNRAEARCPVCDMLERHRAIWLFFQQKTNLMDGQPKKMMHVAPEPEMGKLFRKTKGIDYLSVDLDSPYAMEKVDICDIPYGSDEFDIIYCSHVLEHVPDDKKAVREFFRVLKPGGWAVICVPIDSEKTFVDPMVTDPKERERLFGQCDHVRRYGPDVIERIQSAGFNVESFSPSSFMSEEELSKCAIGREKENPVFYCQKNET